MEHAKTDQTAEHAHADQEPAPAPETGPTHGTPDATDAVNAKDASGLDAVGAVADAEEAVDSTSATAVKDVREESNAVDAEEAADPASATVVRDVHAVADGTAGATGGEAVAGSVNAAAGTDADAAATDGVKVADVMDAVAFRAWIAEAARLVVDNTDHLTHLDAAIGDADHGVNMRRGFQAAVALLDEAAPPTPGAVLDTVGRALISKIGGASGPLYGTAFRQAAKVLGAEPDVSAPRLGEALRAALAGVQRLGAAKEGDKTMVDALAAAVSAYQAVVETGGGLAGATRAAADAAERGLQATVGMQARKGRASYLGPRTIGHEDPGAASAALIMRALAAVAAKEVT